LDFCTLLDDLTAYCLTPVFTLMKGICKAMRHAKLISSWERSYFSFWVLIISFSFGILFLFFPLTTIFFYLLKILFFTLFGPWMKLIDIYILQNEARNDRKKSDFIVEQVKHWRKNAEHAAKMKEMRVLRHGKYIISIPSLYIPRYYDCPSFESSAKPMSLCQSILCSKESEEKASIIPGQNLHGLMIQGEADAVASNAENSCDIRKNLLTLIKDEGKRKIA